jgi:hypothetical protein
MRGIKFIAFAIVVFSLLQCNKDNELQPISHILENGVYQFHYQKSSGGQGFPLYYVKDNKIFGNYNRVLLCMDRIAGELTYINNSVLVPYLLWQDSYYGNKCAFYNDKFGGDTLIFHLYNIELFKDNNLRNALRGEFYYTNPFPDHRQTKGSFSFTYTPIQ